MFLFENYLTLHIWHNVECNLQTEFIFFYNILIPIYFRFMNQTVNMSRTTEHIWYSSKTFSMKRNMERSCRKYRTWITSIFHKHSKNSHFFQRRLYTILSAVGSNLIIYILFSYSGAKGGNLSGRKVFTYSSVSRLSLRIPSSVIMSAILPKCYSSVKWTSWD